MKLMLIAFLFLPTLAVAIPNEAPKENDETAKRVDAGLKKDAKKIKKIFGIKSTEDEAVKSDATKDEKPKK
jgi:hypothetical protein